MLQILLLLIIITEVYITSGTAVVGEDFDPSYLEVMFAPGASSVAVYITLTDNSVVEDTEVFYIELREARGGILAEPYDARVEIIDDDTGRDKFAFFLFIHSLLVYSLKNKFPRRPEVDLQENIQRLKLERNHTNTNLKPLYTFRTEKKKKFTD